MIYPRKTFFLFLILFAPCLLTSFAQAQTPKIKNYEELVREVKVRQSEAADHGQPIESEREAAIRKAWESGKMIEDFAADNLGDLTFKQELVKRLGVDSGIHNDQLTVRMKFAREYPELPLETSLSWSHYKLLLNVGDKEDRGRLEKEAARNGWGTRELGAAVAAYNRTAAQGKNITAAELGRPYVYRVTFFRNRRALHLGFENYLSPEGIDAFQEGDWVIWENGKVAAFNLKGSPVYHAEINEVNDGDTVHAVIDLGFYLRTEQRLRLNGIDAPELDAPGGAEARQYLKDLVMKSNGQVLLKIGKPDKFNRYLADLWIDGKYINQELIDSGHAVSIAGEMAS